MIMQLLSNLLIFFVLNYLNLSHGYIDDRKIAECIKAELDCLKSGLNLPLIPDGISTKIPEFPHEINAWDEPPGDFYLPNSFNLYAGHKTELFISSLFEDNYAPFSHKPAMDMLLIDERETKILVAATTDNIFVKQILPQAATNFFEEFGIPNVQNMDQVKYLNGTTGESEIYIIALQNLKHIQKILIFKFDINNLQLEFQSSWPIQPHVVKIRVIPVPTAKKNLLFAVRYDDVRRMSSCSSDVFEMMFHENKLTLTELQRLRTSGALDAEPFTINGVTYLAVANSFCLYSDVFVFKVDVNQFYLYQRLPLQNTTDFQYFRLGLRHFVASIGLNDAVIFEWKIDGLEAQQHFPVLSEPSPQDRQWHNLQLPWENEAVLLLVTLSRIQIIKWSSLEGKFIVETLPVCTDFLKMPNLRRDVTIKANRSYHDLNNAKEDCILAREGCPGVSEIEENGVIKYVPESTLYNLIRFPSEENAFWFKTFGIDFSCLIPPTRSIMPKLLSYSSEDLVYVIAPFFTETRTFVFNIIPAQIIHSSSPSSVMVHINEQENRLETFEEKLKLQIIKDIPQNLITSEAEHTIIQPTMFNTTVTAVEHLNLDVFHFDVYNGAPILGEWEERFRSLNEKIADFYNLLKNAIDLTKRPVHIPSNVHFTAVEVKERVDSIHKAEITRINNVPIVHFIENAATWDQKEQIYGKKIFTRRILHTGNIRVVNLIAGHRFPDDIVTTGTEQTLDGEWQFDENIEIRVVKMEVLNGIDLNQTVMSLHAEQTVIHHAPKVFMDRLEVRGNIEVHKINGIDLRDIVEHAVTKSGTRPITGRKIFAKNVIVNRELNIEKTINGFDIVRYDSEIVKLNKPASITGLKIFTRSVFANKDVHVRGLINEQDFPRNFVLQNSKISLDAEKRFFSPLVINGDLRVTDTINGLPVDSAVTTHTPQVIYDEKIFVGGMNIRSLSIDGTIDGTTIEELQNIADHGRPFTSDRFVSFNVTRNLEHVSMINGHYIADLLQDAVFKEDKDITFTEEKVFLKSTRIIGTVEHLNIINKMNLQTDFLTYQKPQNIIGRKTFIKRTIFQDVQIDGMLNEHVNITEYLHSVVSLHSPWQEIRGEMRFVDGFTIESSLTVNGAIDSVHIPSDVVFTNESKTIFKPKLFFHGIKTNILTTNNLALDGTLNGIDWNNFAVHRVTLSTPQEIFSDITFLDEVTITKSLHVTNKINHVDLHKMIDDAMLKSRDSQRITGLKTITGGITAENVITGSSRGFSNVNFTQLDTTIIRIHDNEIKGKIYFDEVQVKEKTIIEGEVNGKDLIAVIDDAVKKSSDTVQHITGVKVFSETVDIKGDLIVITVNGYNPLTDFLLKSPPQTIPGSFDLQNVVVKTDVSVDGKVNGIDLILFDKKVMKINEDITLSTLTVIDDVFVEKDLIIFETINEIDLKELMENSVSKHGVIEIKGFTEFTGTIHVFGNMEVEDTVNGFKLSRFVKDVVLINKNEAVEITGIKTFSGEVETTESIEIIGNVTIKGNVKQINLNHLLKSTFYPNESRLISGEKTFQKLVIVEDNVKFKTTINQIKLPDDVVLKTGNQPIFGTKRFEHVIVRGDIIAQHVNGYILQDLYHDTVFHPINKPITGLKILKKKTLFRSRVNVLGNVCGVHFGTDVMTTHEPQTVTGEKTFSHITVTGNININKLNGYELGLPGNLLENLKPSAEAHHRFLGTTVFSNVETEIVELELPEVGIEIDGLSQLTEKLKVTSFDAIKKCEAVDTLAKPLVQAPEKLDHFEFLYSTDFSADGHSEIIQSEKNVYLLYKANNEPCEPYYPYIWTKENKFVRLQGEIAKGNSIRFQHFVHKNEEFVVFVQPDQTCATPSRIYKINKYTAKFELFCTFRKPWIKHAAVIQDRNLLYIATISNMEILSLNLDTRSEFCLSLSSKNFTTVGDFLVALKHHNLFVVTDSMEIDFFLPTYNPTYNRRSMPGIRHLISASTNGKEFLVMARNIELTNLHMIQVFEFEVTNFRLNLIKQMAPSESPILDVKVFTWGVDEEPYLAISYYKVGISITKLSGYETFDKIDLPIASVKHFDVFLWEKRPYLLISPVGRKRDTEIHVGIIKGVNVQLNMTCSP